MFCYVLYPTLSLKRENQKLMSMEEYTGMLNSLKALKGALEKSPEKVMTDLLEMVMYTAKCDSVRIWVDDNRNSNFIRCLRSLPVMDDESWRELQNLRVNKSTKIVKDAFNNVGRVQMQEINGKPETRDAYAKFAKQAGLNFACAIDLGGKHRVGLIAIDFGKRELKEVEIKHAKEALEVSATLIGLLFSNEEWVNSLEVLSKTDGLTDLYNSREYVEYLKKAVEEKRANKTKEPIFVAEFDVDDFKQINDKYERHIVGDKVLKEIGERILNFISFNKLQKSMYAFRRGGDEFAFLIKGKNRKECRAIVSGLFKAVSKEPLEVIYVNDNGNKVKTNISITISVGCGMLERRHTYQDLRNTVDARLYYAKRKGKNRIIGKEEHEV